MTRICMDCKKLLGEKCPNCGCERLTEIGPKYVRCNECDLEFTLGEGGETHGICEPCIAHRRVLEAAERSA